MPALADSRVLRVLVDTQMITLSWKVLNCTNQLSQTFFNCLLWTLVWQLIFEDLDKMRKKYLFKYFRLTQQRSTINIYFCLNFLFFCLLPHPYCEIMPNHWGEQEHNHCSVRPCCLHFMCKRFGGANSFFGTLEKMKHLEGEGDARSSTLDIRACRQVPYTCGRWT